MKIQTTKDVLAAATKRAAKVARAKSTIPVLSHVAVDFDGETVTITANDSIRTYSEKFPAQGEPGQCTIEADKLAKAANGMKSGEIELTPTQIKQGRSKIKLESLRYSDFPQPDYGAADDCGITGEQLADAIAFVAHAIPTKDVRHILNGVHLTNGFCVATDGHRLAFTELPYEGPDIIIPADSARQIGAMSGQVKVSDRQLVIDGDSSRFSTGLIEGKYVDWRRVVPKDLAQSVTFDCDAMIAELRTMALGGTLVKMTFADGQIAMVNEGAETAIDFEGQADLVIGYNIQYLIDALSTIGGGAVTMAIQEGRPCLINDNLIVMPVRL